MVIFELLRFCLQLFWLFWGRSHYLVVYVLYLFSTQILSRLQNSDSDFSQLFAMRFPFVLILFSQSSFFIQLIRFSLEVFEGSATSTSKFSPATCILDYHFLIFLNSLVANLQKVASIFFLF